MNYFWANFPDRYCLVPNYFPSMNQCFNQYFFSKIAAIYKRSIVQ
jgi:hypothetical protein